MRASIFLSLILGLMVLVLGQTSSSNFANNQISNELCSSPTHGLQLCTSSSSIVVKSGQNVLVNLTLKNISKENILASSIGPFDPQYKFVVKDDSGNEILSTLETLKRKMENHTISKEESSKLFELCCIDGGSRGDLQLPKNQSTVFIVNLSSDYDLTKKGKYHLEIIRKIAKADKKGYFDLNLKGITIEVK